MRESASAAAARIGERTAGRFDAELPDAAALERFERDGFLEVGAVTTHPELEWLRRFYDVVFAERICGVAGGYLDLTSRYDSESEARLPQVLLPELALPELGRTNFVRNAAAIGARLLGVPVAGIRVACHLIAKPARSGAETPWHQDEAYWDPAHDHRAVSVWMPLDDADAASGCLAFLPGSHRGGVLEHHHIGGDDQIQGLVAPGVDGAGAITCPVIAGSATVHDRRTLHASGPNVSDRARRACIAVAQTKPSPRAVPYSRPWLSHGQRERNPGQ